jgi:hypothetical protein
MVRVTIIGEKRVCFMLLLGSAAMPMHSWVFPLKQDTGSLGLKAEFHHRSVVRPPSGSEFVGSKRGQKGVRDGVRDDYKDGVRDD